MIIFAAAMLAAYLGYLIWERTENVKNRRLFMHVIHVNGTRGKTGTARMTDACLRAGGYRVFTKTTGSDAAYIDTEGNEHRIRRFGPPAVSEQFRILRMAAKQNAQIVIIECMAVKPELQKLCQDSIVMGDLNVITNVRYDHLYEMGPELEKIAESLSSTVPENGVLFTADEKFYGYFQEKCREKNSECILCTVDGEAEDENSSIAVAIGQYLGIDEKICRNSLKNAVSDYATRKEYDINGHVFLNLFSANDPQSTMQLIDKYRKNTDMLPVFVYNNREDRPDRVIAFAEYFFTQLTDAQVLVTGQCRALACRIFKKHGIKAREAAVEEIIKLTEKEDLVGIGNVKGDAGKILAFLEKRVGTDE